MTCDGWVGRAKPPVYDAQKLSKLKKVILYLFDARAAEKSPHTPRYYVKMVLENLGLHITGQMNDTLAQMLS